MQKDNNLLSNQLNQKQLQQKKQLIQQQSEKIIAIAKNESQSSLKCIHLLSVAGGATSETYTAIEQRIIQDKDTHGAYHLALMAQSTPDLPIDVRQLIELVVFNGDSKQLVALLKNLPVPPVEMIQQKVVESGDKHAINEMLDYLKSNPDGIGSHNVLGSGQKERILPLSEG